MDIRSLREDRRHGSPDFPFATYEQERQAGDTILDNHWHEEAEFFWLTSGQAVFQIGLAEFELRAGEAVYIPSGEIHGGYSSQGAACTFRAMVFHLDWLGESGDGIGAKYMKPLQSGDAAIPSFFDKETQWGRRTLERLARLYELRETNDPAMEFRIKAELYLLFADLLSAGQWSFQPSAGMANPSASDQMKSVVAHIESNSAQPLNVTELARVAGMSAGHFSRVFKTYMRKSPMEYVNHYRMRKAAYMLRNPNMSVGQVALEAGMSNFSYFCKAFKSQFGYSPSDYRKKLRSL